jgi:2-dehydro-3-deoxyphosphogluconate aldolase / (4S)-4-hydroxy-2-oxoglutarate aldolase
VKTAGDFIKAGCAAVAAGSSLVSKDILAKKDWKGLADISRQFVDAVAAARRS